MDSAIAEANRTVVLKVSDGLAASVENGFLGSSSAKLAAVVGMLSGVPVQRFFVQGYAELDQLRTTAMAAGAWPVPQELNLYFRIKAADPLQAQDWVNRLSGLEGVQHCYLQPAPSAPPQDIPPNTADWTANQGYFQAPGPGTNQWEVAGVLGARGRDIRVTDCEYDWVLDHEDLELDSSRLVGGTPIGIYSDHGTAVAGELYAQDNDYGVTGGVPHADIYFATEYATSFGYSPTQAILNATIESGNGDVILLEMQTGGPTGAYVPEEWTPASFAAVETATALGIHVVEAGGNGGMDLDSGVFGGYFDTNIQDSRAVIVGAGTSNADHTKLWYTSRGSRIDCQAWGENVYTAGYGSLWQYGSDDRQDYTSSFSGTSSASPIVTSAITATLGVMKAHGMTLPEPVEMRKALRNTGTPQLASDVASGRIGPMPDLEALLDWFNVPTGLRHAPRAAIGTTLTLELEGPSKATWDLYHSFSTEVSFINVGTLILPSWSIRWVASGALEADGTGSYTAAIPNNPALQGQEVFLQVLFGRYTNPYLSNGGMVTLY